MLLELICMQKSFWPQRVSFENHKRRLVYVSSYILHEEASEVSKHDTASRTVR